MQLVKIFSEDDNLSKEQKIFNKLAEQIEKKKRELDKWERYAQDHRRKHAELLVPLENELYKNKKKIIIFFDSKLQDKELTDAEEKKLKTFIFTICSDLLDEKHDEKVEELLEKYRPPEPKKKHSLDSLIEEFSSRMEENMHQWHEDMAENNDEEDFYKKKTRDCKRKRRERINEKYL